MKRLFILLLSLLCLTSCSSEKNYFSKERTLSVRFSDGTLDCRGILHTDGSSVSFSPSHLDGYTVTFTENGGSVSYLGMTFEDIWESSRFTPLVKILKGDAKTVFKKGKLVSIDLEQAKITEIEEINTDGSAQMLR